MKYQTYSPSVNNPQEITSIDESHTKIAMDSIYCEQIKQKMHYDKKVDEGGDSGELSC